MTETNQSQQTTTDVLLIGGGIMSATLATMIAELEPSWTIRVLERLDRPARESTGPWNNAGTGHAALCELNYTPQAEDGSVDISKAVVVNEQFALSRQLWSFLVENGRLPSADAFIHPTPHMSFVWGADNVAYLRERHRLLSEHPLFEGMLYTEDPEQIRAWAPLLLEGRDSDEPIAATYAVQGTDVDFGALTELLLGSVAERGLTVDYNADVSKVKRADDGLWIVKGKKDGQKFEHRARFVFVGAGGRALTLLQKSKIPEIKGFGGFPVSGEFLRTDNPEIVARHHAKVYGKAAVGAPPMSVPHLDTRVVNGKTSLMFGPYAGFSPRYLKHGSLLDMFKAIRWHNLIPMMRSGLANIPLTIYLITQLISRPKTKFKDLLDFFPDADMKDWQKIIAGQRVQVIRPNGVLQFGTEVITHADGSIAGLLGASPGASTAAPIMFEVLERCFPSQWDGWQPKLTEMVPSHGHKLSDEPGLAREVQKRTAEVLGLDLPEVPEVA
ncbi:malate dehydrogenase (quinone) [Nocardioides jejuensis]|uniref:Probable malate:quinone oxidoreductase n=1 Tax=Nocardioides jejuensis TaxID=2502782 RepID=A0A4R1C0B5_9ACTN|nr:malate dehydrogenase (quinone) [Nocardioides jejuensis]TCJ23883.1 malate dehydrogenase (quinone) [Nocardioides jejuensis]